MLATPCRRVERWNTPSTERHLIEKFQPGGQLALPELMSLPTLFLEESSSQGDPLASVGTITGAKISGREIIFE